MALSQQPWAELRWNNADRQSNAEGHEARLPRGHTACHRFHHLAMLASGAMTRKLLLAQMQGLNHILNPSRVFRLPTHAAQVRTLRSLALWC